MRYMLFTVVTLAVPHIAFGQTATIDSVTSDAVATAVRGNPRIRLVTDFGVHVVDSPIITRYGVTSSISSGRSVPLGTIQQVETLQSQPVADWAVTGGVVVGAVALVATLLKNTQVDLPHTCIGSRNPSCQGQWGLLRTDAGRVARAGLVGAAVGAVLGAVLGETFKRWKVTYTIR